MFYVITPSLVFHMSQRFFNTYAMMLVKLSRAPTLLVIKKKLASSWMQTMFFPQNNNLFQ